MTIGEVKELYNGDYNDIEVYEPLSKGKHYPSEFHTDNCKCIESFSDNMEVGLYELMNQDDYNDTLMANCDIYADFDDLYGDKNAKIICIMIK